MSSGRIDLAIRERYYRIYVIVDPCEDARPWRSVGRDDEFSSC